MNTLKFLLPALLMLNLASLSAQPSTSLQIKSSGLRIDFEVYENKHLRLLNILPESFPSQAKPEKMNNEAGFDVFMYGTGENRTIHHGNPGLRLEYLGMEERILPSGKVVVLRQKDPVKNLLVESFYELTTRVPWSDAIRG